MGVWIKLRDSGGLWIKLRDSGGCMDKAKRQWWVCG